jgi:3-oxoacyl-[acyl-carrier-protein] synthase I
MPAMMPLRLTHYTAASALGCGRLATLSALQTAAGALRRCQFENVELEMYVGEVDAVDEVALPHELRGFNCRNNRLAWMGLTQDGFDAEVRACAARWGRRRVGVLLGTSTSGILETENAYRRRNPDTGALPDEFDYPHQHNSFSVVEFTRRLLELDGPAMSVCTACSSSAKVFAAAERWITAGVIDAAVVGGVDSLCLTTLYGFHALQLVSRQPCRPYDRLRDGLSIGEAAAFVLLERAPANLDFDSVLLLGTGESSDAYHMSSPHPDGDGALRAMRAALDAAQLPAARVDYINLHGTGTASNDRTEARAVAALFGNAVPCSSTKGATGHTLGAAGALEAVICALALQAGLMPGGLNVRELDPQLGINYLTANRRGPLSRVLSNSFGFGGANCALLFGRAQ